MSGIVTTLYRVCERKLERKLNECESHMDCIQRVIIGEANKSLKDNPGKYVLAEMKEPLENIRLFLHPGVYPVKWVDFLTSVAHVESISNTVHSFIMIIHRETKYFILAGGYGHFYVSPLEDERFGLDILERLYTEYDEKIIALNNRSFMGNLLGEAKVFRGRTKVNAEKDYLKMINRSYFQLDVHTLKNKLGIQCTTGCIGVASSGLKLTKNMTFSEYELLIKNVTKLLLQKPKMHVNMVDPVSDEIVIEQCDAALDKALLEVVQGKRSAEDIDVTNRDILGFLNSTRIKVTHDRKTLTELAGPPVDLTNILDLVNKKCKLTKKNIRMVLNKVKIKSYSENSNKPLNNDDFFDHLCMEISTDTIKGFYLESKWYKFDDNLSKRVNDEFISKFTNLIDKSNHWFDLDINAIREEYKKNNDTKRVPIEGQYNLKYIDQPDTYVLDTICHQNVELCDILRFEGDTTYLIHVKQGFSGAIRELASQMVGAAKKIYTWNAMSKAKSEKEMRSFFAQVKAKYKKYSPKTEFQLTADQFIKRMTDSNNIVFCMAFSDKRETQDFVANIDTYRSLIAKISSLEMYRRINEMGFKIKLIRIQEV